MGAYSYLSGFAFGGSKDGATYSWRLSQGAVNPGIHDNLQPNLGIIAHDDSTVRLVRLKSFRRRKSRKTVM